MNTSSKHTSMGQIAYRNLTILQYANETKYIYISWYWNTITTPTLNKWKRHSPIHAYHYNMTGISNRD